MPCQYLPLAHFKGRLVMWSMYHGPWRQGVWPSLLMQCCATSMSSFKCQQQPQKDNLLKQVFTELLGSLIAINSTHVSIRCPSGNKNAYRDRKRWHTMNFQVLCDHNSKILSVCAKYPGSAHDALILHNSLLWQKMYNCPDERFLAGW